MSETTVMANPLEIDTLNAILKRLCQNGYGINRYEELLQEIINEVCEKFVVLHSIGYATLREQIAREILAKCENKTETNTSEFGSLEVVGCLEFIQLEDTAYYEVTCTHAEDAAIAMGNL